MRKLLATMVFAIAIFAGFTARAGMLVPKVGDIVPQGEYAVITLKAHGLGWHGKKVLVKAKEDFEILNTEISFHHLLNNGSLELQREATIAMGITLPWMMSGNKVMDPKTGVWVYHSYFKPVFDGYFYILGEKIETNTRWLELGGKAGAFNDAAIVLEQLNAENEIILEKLNTVISTISSSLYYDYAGVIHFTRLENGGFRAVLYNDYNTWWNYFGIGFAYFNSDFELHKEDGPAILIRESLTLEYVPASYGTDYDSQIIGAIDLSHSLLDDTLWTTVESIEYLNGVKQ